MTCRPAFAVFLAAALVTAACVEDPDARVPRPASSDAVPEPPATPRALPLLDVEQPTLPPSVAWELRPAIGEPERVSGAWIMQEIPGSTLYQEAPATFVDEGLRLPFAAPPPDGRPLFAQLRERFSDGVPGRRFLVALVDVDAQATLRVEGRVRADDGTPMPLHVLEYAARPPTPAAILQDFLGGLTLASQTASPGPDGRAAATFTTTPRSRVAVVLAGVLGEPPGPDLVVEQARLVDTGERAGEAAALDAQVVDEEARAGLVLTRGARARFTVPARERPMRVELGTATLRRPGSPRLVVGLGALGEAPRPLLDEPLPRPRGEAPERWSDRAVRLPPGPAGVLSVRVEADGEEGVAVVLAQPQMLADDGSRRGTPEHPNVILVSIDTLRADALGSAGGHPQASPTLDALSERFCEFTECVAAAPYTLPSHVTMLSGQQPTIHGVAAPSDGIVPERTPLLAPRLSELGFVTAAFTGGGYLDRRYGFSDGFDRYAQRDEMLVGRDDHLRWLDAHADQRFFLFLHTYAVHEATRLGEPYVSRFDAGCEVPELHGPQRFARMLETADEELTRPELEHLQRCYAGALRQADDAFALVMRRLEALDLLDSTIVVVTSDHGEELGDHGGFGHGHTLYEELLLVPLLVWLPDGSVGGRDVDAPVGVIDVAPTIYDLLGLPPDERLQGRSLAPLMRGAPLPPRPLVAEVDAETRKTALRFDGHKVVRAPLDPQLEIPNRRAWEHYALEADPGERHDLAGAPVGRQVPIEALSDVTRPWARRLDALMEAWRARAAQLDTLFGDGERVLSAEEEAELRRLGYLGG